MAGLDDEADLLEIMTNRLVHDYFKALLMRLNSDATGSANRISWMRLLETPPSIDHNEITDKGSINQSAVLARRADLVDALYYRQDAFLITA